MEEAMISHPELHAVPSLSTPRWPKYFSHWQLMSLVPGVVHRLATAARVVELEVGSPALLTILARIYPYSQFIGLTSYERSKAGQGSAEMVARNLHFRTVEEMDLSGFRQVDLLLALGGVTDRGLLLEIARTMAPGGHLLLRERDRGAPSPDAPPRRGTRHLSAVTADWVEVDPMHQGPTIRTLSNAFMAVHSLRLPEDPGFVYYVARTG
jgi:hypothetical protein